MLALTFKLVQWQQEWQNFNSKLTKESFAFNCLQESVSKDRFQLAWIYVYINLVVLKPFELQFKSSNYLNATRLILLPLPTFAFLLELITGFHSQRASSSGNFGLFARSCLFGLLRFGSTWKKSAAECLS